VLFRSEILLTLRLTKMVLGEQISREKLTQTIQILQPEAAIMT
jgi:hypothetical protein